jgi:glucose-6-phosphate 1-dehydrogenase
MENNTADTNITEDAMASVIAPDLGLDALACVAPRHSDPCTIVIMGAIGDLTKRKLMPALFDIVGASRREIDEQEFRAKMQSALKKAGVYDETRWPSFAESLYHCYMDFEDPDSFKNLVQLIWTKNLTPAETGSFIWRCRRRFTKQLPG